MGVTEKKTNNNTNRVNRPKKGKYMFQIIILVYGIITITVGAFIAKEPVYYIIGESIGIILSLLWVQDMYMTINKALDKEPQKAVLFTRIHTITRFLLIAAVSVAMIYINLVALVGLFVGLIGVKIGAYAYPFIDNSKNKK